MKGGPGYPAWAHTTDEVLAHHQVDEQLGLSDAQVEAQRIKYGYNELEKEPGTPLWKLVLAQFDDMLVKVPPNATDIVHDMLCLVQALLAAVCHSLSEPAIMAH